MPGRASLDRLGELLLPRRPAGDETSEDRALANYLGIEGASAWPTPGDVAKACEIPRSVVATALEQARDRWHRAGFVTTTKEVRVESQNWPSIMRL